MSDNPNPNTPHSTYPHEDGYLADCVACESICHCTAHNPATSGTVPCVFHAEDNPNRDLSTSPSGIYPEDYPEMHWQYCDQSSNRDITGDYYAEQDADSVRAWSDHGDPLCLVEVTARYDAVLDRRYGDSWVITSSDLCIPDIAAYDMRFHSPYDALVHVLAHKNDTPVERRPWVDPTPTI